jgi:hypothetical protein
MTDTTGKRSKKLGERAYPVEDERFTVSCKDMLPFVVDNGLVNTPVDMPHPFSASVVKSLLPDISDPSLNNNVSILADWSERFPQKLSAAEFVTGLGELKRLLPTYAGSITKFIAQGYLTDKFGWENLLSDLTALGNLVDSTTRRLAYLKANYGKPTRLTWVNRDLQLTLPDPVIQSLAGYEGIWDRGWDCRLTRLEYRCDVGASCTLVQKLEHLDDTIGLLRGLIGALGLNNPLKAAWELMPFSFVVDWFLKISDHLTLWAAAQPAEEWGLYDVVRTRKEYALFKVEQINSNIEITPGVFVSTGPGLMGTIRFDRFSRGVGLPLPPSIFTLGGLSPQQLVLALALLAAGSK